jgi:DNA-binding MarR family transcriptional regulator
MDFATLREIVEVSESVLSKHLKQLEDAGYVSIDKRTSMSRVRTWLALTPVGRAALAAHLAALRTLMAVAEPTAGRRRA